ARNIYKIFEDIFQNPQNQKLITEKNRYYLMRPFQPPNFAKRLPLSASRFPPDTTPNLLNDAQT
ncbi:MAG TPA: hypothetical protein PLK63_08510, partial [Catalimonadaceae bacterium]|nr:hypothetical protein [Catalimonadaceae bacterium]